MELLEFLLQIIFRMPLWALFASPLLALLIFVEGGIQSKTRGKQLIFCSLGSALIAPAPTGIFLAFVPLVYMAAAGMDYFKTIWLWLSVSYPMTWILLFLITNRRFGAGYNKEKQGGRPKGRPSLRR